jgi:hypothetical protein
MPSYSVALANFHAEVERIQKTERIVSVVPSGEGAYLVVTEPITRAKPNEVETR